MVSPLLMVSRALCLEGEGGDIAPKPVVGTRFTMRPSDLYMGRPFTHGLGHFPTVAPQLLSFGGTTK